MKHEADQLRELITGMRAAYARGENAMAYARNQTSSNLNSTAAALVAYDLQAGTYCQAVRDMPAVNARWCAQLAAILGKFVTSESSLLEVGCGEATTLGGTLRHLPVSPRSAAGFDISWSRCATARLWLGEQKADANLFVADLFNIPLADECIDIVYTSHSIEPNGGREREALFELLRITRRTLVLVEPLFELASAEAQSRMRHHGYVRNLQKTLQDMNANVTEAHLLEFTHNPLNPSGVIIVEKKESDTPTHPSHRWRCPLTHTPLTETGAGDALFSSAAGIAYPILRGIPLLRGEHAVVASKLTV